VSVASLMLSGKEFQAAGFNDWLHCAQSEPSTVVHAQCENISVTYNLVDNSHWIFWVYIHKWWFPILSTSITFTTTMNRNLLHSKQYRVTKDATQTAMETDLSVHRTKYSAYKTNSLPTCNNLSQLLVFLTTDHLTNTSRHNTSYNRGSHNFSLSYN